MILFYLHTVNEILFLANISDVLKYWHFGQNNCLPNILLHCEFSLSMEDPNFSQNNCLKNNFLHCEFQLSMLSTSKVSVSGV